jgi:alpha,alpha-trehalose phosphorylase
MDLTIGRVTPRWRPYRIGGGVWLALVYGFAGLRDLGGQLSFDPHLPAEWTVLSFALTVRGQVLQVDLRHDSIILRLRHGDLLEARVRGTSVEIQRGLPVSVNLAQ